MNDVQLKIDETKRGEFVIEEDQRPLGTMKVHLEENNLVVDGTVVEKEARGRNIGKKLIEAMADHARTNHYQVVPHCPFVRGQFEKHPEDYSDIWKKSA
jgi:predicted GNAT family acetyltransferase